MTHPAPPAPQDEPVTFLCNVLTEAAKQFRLYESLHARKGTPDGDEKALTNAAHALACEAAVAMARTQAAVTRQAIYLALIEVAKRHDAATAHMCTEMTDAILAAGFRKPAPAPESEDVREIAERDATDAALNVSKYLVAGSSASRAIADRATLLRVVRGLEAELARVHEDIRRMSPGHDSV